jgi:YVTN family beta-propeller protein
VAVSPDGTKVYVTADYTTNNLNVIDTTASNAVTAISTGGNNPYGVAFSPDGAKAYVSNRDSGTVSVINTSNNTVTATVTVGTSPEGVAFSTDGTKAYVANTASASVSVIATSNNTVTDTITVGNAPRGVAVSPDGTKVYVANDDSNNVSVIDTATNTVTTTITVGNDPRFVAVSPDGTKAYVANQSSNNVSVIELPVTASSSSSSSSSSGVPGIFLAVNPVLVGKPVEGAPIYCGADSIQPNSNYTLSVQSVTNSALTRTVLDSGTVNTQGHLNERVLLGALNPGSYKIVMTGIHASGYPLVLTNYITVGANGVIVSVSAENLQPFLN